MTQTQAQRFTTAMGGALGSLKMGDKVRAEANGPMLIQVREGNQIGFDMGYLAMVVLDHNRLLNQPPIAVSVGIRGLMPPQNAFESAVPVLLEECRRLRDKANNPEPSVDEVKAAEAVAQAEQSDAFRRKLPVAGPTQQLPHAGEGESGQPIEPAKPRKPRERESHFG